MARTSDCPGNNCQDWEHQKRHEGNISASDLIYLGHNYRLYGRIHLLLDPLLSEFKDLVRILDFPFLDLLN